MLLKRRSWAAASPWWLARALTLVLAALFAIGLLSPVAVVVVALVLSLAAGVAMTAGGRLPAVVAWRRRRPHPTVREDLWWNAQAFSFLLGGVFLGPAAYWSGRWPSSLLLAVCLVLALLSALTPFCVGRLLYVVLFERKRRSLGC